MASAVVATGVAAAEIVPEIAPEVAIVGEEAAAAALPEVKIAVKTVDEAVKALVAKGVKPESQLLGRFKDVMTGFALAKMTSDKKENDKTGSPSDEKPPTAIIEKTVKGASQDKSPLKMALAIMLIIIVIAIIAAVTKARSGFIMTFGAITGATVLLTLATHILL